MTRIPYLSTVCALMAVLILAACSSSSTPKRDYEASRTCTDRGLATGTDKFKACVEEERGARNMERQHDEFDARQKQDRFERQIRNY